MCNCMVYSITNSRMVGKMSKFDPKDIQINELERALNLEMIKNVVMQDALEHIACDTEENRQSIAQETLEAVAVVK